MKAPLMTLALCWLLVPACYYSPQVRGEKARPDYLSEAEAEQLIQSKMAPYGIKFVSNMKLKRDNVVFVADGYDRDIRVGYEYRSREGFDFETEDNDAGDGLSDREIEALVQRQHTFREYFLVVPEGRREEVEQSVENFIKDLYTWEVLKKAKTADKTEELFPEKGKSLDELLPWESTKKIEEKKKKEEQQKTIVDDDEVWEQQQKQQTQEKADDSWPVQEEEKENKQVDDSDFDF